MAIPVLVGSMPAVVVVKGVLNVVIMTVVLVIMLEGCIASPLVHYRSNVLICQSCLFLIEVPPCWFLWRSR
jgi:hypothetical protein